MTNEMEFYFALPDLQRMGYECLKYDEKSMTIIYPVDWMTGEMTMDTQRQCLESLIQEKIYSFHNKVNGYDEKHLILKAINLERQNYLPTPYRHEVYRKIEKEASEVYKEFLEDLRYHYNGEGEIPKWIETFKDVSRYLWIKERMKELGYINGMDKWVYTGKGWKTLLVSIIKGSALKGYCLKDNFNPKEVISFCSEFDIDEGEIKESTIEHVTSAIQFDIAMQTLKEK